MSAPPVAVTAYTFCKDISVPPAFHGSRVALWPQHMLQRLPEGGEVKEAITTHLPGPQNEAPRVFDNGGPVLTAHCAAGSPLTRYQAEQHTAK